ncbi:MAG: lamin tail domain-containing protein, partial [Myxococcota bacterium]
SQPPPPSARYNTTTTTFELGGCVIADEDTDSHTILGSLVIFPGAYLTFAISSMPGFTPDYTYTDVMLANGVDELLISCGDAVIDRVAYDSAAFPSQAGASMNLDSSLLDASLNDGGGSWCASVTSYNGDRGTPGQANEACPGSTNDAGVGADTGVTDGGAGQDAGVADGGAGDAAVPDGGAGDASVSDAGVGQDAAVGDAGTGPVPPSMPGQLVITEIMHNPSMLSDAVGEWFEVYNPSATVTYELDGCEIKDDGTDSHVILGPLQVGPGEFLAMANSAMAGFTAGYVYDGSMFTFDDDTDEVVLKCSAEFIDRVAYDNGATFPNPEGRSMNLSPGLDAFENNVGTNWCEASASYNGDLGTPGAANTMCP